MNPGYYPGYKILDQQKAWDEATRRVVRERIDPPPPIRFFSPGEVELLTAVCNHILPQDDRDPGRRIPIVPAIDARLHEGRTAGYRFDDMPHDRDAYRFALETIDVMARDTFGETFLDIGMREQEELLKSLHDGKPMGAPEAWASMPVQRFWLLLVGDCISAYYSHPWAWDEVGFGGPAYPRAYFRLENGEAEPWEKPEKRHAWTAPEWALSDRFEPVAGPDHEPPGQAGTH